ncbi:DUF4134 domain-containing protein [Bacteroides xylanisolvens]|jgi:hypothetical protein|uniref:DUF4134 domain-containing protein n=1 Tax=Bacteroides xylanisolvens TaxID=371601 RepID=A0A7J5PVK7_9BACE|nr:DUF4134 family protein [Bacteroides xylanisolvens]KAB6146697.1 DUF4134 domain-containing protein [Bacteroides xylanisolvens]
MLSKILKSFWVLIGPFSVQSVLAKSGGVDYSWGADTLALMHDYVVTMMLYVLYLGYAIAAIVAVIASLQIYIKMNVGEEGVTKEILFLIGACIFMISASILFPSFFGYQI